MRHCNGQFFKVDLTANDVPDTPSGSTGRPPIVDASLISQPTTTSTTARSSHPPLNTPEKSSSQILTPQITPPIRPTVEQGWFKNYV